LGVAGDEGEWHAVDLGVLGGEAAGVGVDGVTTSAQPAPDYLLAQQLAAERADPEDVGDGVCIPALGEHGDRDDAADVLAELAPLADGVHRLAQQVGVGELVDVGAGVAQPVGGLERRHFYCGVGEEVTTERLARLEPDRVDQHRPHPGAPCSVHDVAEQWQVALGQLQRAVGQPDLPAGDPVEDQLGDRGVGADGDQYRRRLTGSCQLVLVPSVVGLVAPVEAAQRPLKSGWHHPALRAYEVLLRSLLG
jgi:hypothetical protein